MTAVDSRHPSGDRLRPARESGPAICRLVEEGTGVREIIPREAMENAGRVYGSEETAEAAILNAQIRAQGAW